MNIAICDDNFGDIKYLENLILEAAVGIDKIFFHEFSNGTELLKYYNKFDIVFLDIEMQGKLEGIETAEQIRNKDKETLISFYSVHDLPASRIVEVRPFSYLVKFSAKEKLQNKLRQILRKADENRNKDSLVVSYDGKTYLISLSDIVYISILDKGSLIWLTEKRAEEIIRESKKIHTHFEPVLKSGIKLEMYYEQLKDKGFIYAKKSYIINAMHVIARLKDTVVLTGNIELTVARSKKKQFDHQLSMYWGKQFYTGEDV